MHIAVLSVLHLVLAVCVKCNVWVEKQLNQEYYREYLTILGEINCIQIDNSIINEWNSQFNEYFITIAQ